MAIAWGAVGSPASDGTTSVTPTLPSVASGDLIILQVASRQSPDFPSTPSGYTLLGRHTGGSGSAGADSGDVTMSLYYRVSDGTETGTVTITGSATTVMRAHAYNFTKASGQDWEIAHTQGIDSTTGTAWSVTGDADPGFATNDFCFIATATNSDNGTVSSHAISGGTITFGTVSERFDSVSANGNDLSSSLATCGVTSVVASGIPTYTATRSASGANSHCGVSLIVRLREVPPVTSGTGTSDGTSTASATGSSTAATAGSSAGTATATAVGSSIAEATGSAAGTSTATGVAASPESVGTSAGTSTATAVGSSIAEATGSASGTSTATAVGLVIIEAVGTSVGSASASTVGSSVAVAVGTAVGTSTAIAFSPSPTLSRYHATARVLDYIGTVRN